MSSPVARELGRFRRRGGRPTRELNGSVENDPLRNSGTRSYRHAQWVHRTTDKANSLKRQVIEQRPERFSRPAVNQSKADASSDRNRDLPKTRAARHMFECFLRLIERKRSIDDGLHSVDAYCISHRLEIFDRSDGDALQALLLQHYERKA